MTIFDLTLLYYSKNKCEILFKRRSLKSLRGPVFIQPAAWNYRTLETFSLNIACAKLKRASRPFLTNGSCFWSLCGVHMYSYGTFWGIFEHSGNDFHSIFYKNGQLVREQRNHWVIKMNLPSACAGAGVSSCTGATAGWEGASSGFPSAGASAEDSKQHLRGTEKQQSCV